MKTTSEKIETLVQWKPNPRRGNVSVIAESLKANGQYKPVVVQKSSRKILTGNHLVKAAARLGWTTVECNVIDVDDETAKRIVLADNRTSEVGGIDNKDLAELLGDVSDLTGTGYEPIDLAKLGLVVGVEDEKPEIEFSPAIWESSNYVVLLFDNEIDWKAAQQTFGLTTVKTWDDRPGYERKGIGRVIRGADVVKRLNGEGR